MTSLLTRLTEAYDKVTPIAGEHLEPDEMLAFMLGYLDGEKGGPSKWSGSWYKQGFKHGELGGE